MALLLPIKPLDGADGYLRWKESVLLRLHTINVAHVLSKDPPPPPGGDGDDDVSTEAVAEKWARDDAVSRGHILAALSDRLFRDYAHHTTARAVWEAVARTYDLDTPGASIVSMEEFKRFSFDDDGDTLLEQLAHAEALGVGGLPPSFVPHLLYLKLPSDVAVPAMMASPDGGITMDNVWRAARARERVRMEREAKDDEAMTAGDHEEHKEHNARKRKLEMY